ncbi:MAG: GNAT family N-acetyltransferase [Anaerolineales bacterium]|nr:GNAT family N-acetyltransferase [Anaerolineales bacterium]
MPEIHIRPAIATDIPTLVALEHHYSSDYVWQMEFQHEREQGQIMVNFRQVRLPRPVRVDYPRSPRALAAEWEHCSEILVALMEEEPVGYVSLALDRIPAAAWASDLVVARRLRRQGIGSALLLAASEWARQMERHNLILEMQPKNYPAIQMALKMGFEFCGYNDRYYAKHQIGIFFGKSL